MPHIVLYQVDLPYACFGIECTDSVCTLAAPIGKWMLGNSILYIADWVVGKGGKIRIAK